MELLTGASMEICLGRLRANVRRVLAAAGSRRLIAVVKADAYGHGVVEVARTISEERVYAFATGSLDDAVAMREAGIRLPIIMLGNLPPECLPVVVDRRLTPSISSRQAGEAVASFSGGEPISVYVKVDAGFGRFGVLLDSACDLVSWIASLPELRLEGVYTHVPFRDAVGRDWARGRLDRFGALLDRFEASHSPIPVTQAISSAGLEAGLHDRCNTVACGGLLYGLRSLDPALEGRLETESIVTAIRVRLAGVVPRLAERAPEERAPYLRGPSSATGTVPIGLAQGLRQPRPGSKACMLLRGRRVPVLRVCLENTVLDLSGIDEAREGEEVLVLGSDGTASIQASELADWVGQSPMALLLSLGKQVRRSYANGSRA